MYNIDSNGVRYGVVSVNDLDPHVVDALWYGPQARDLSWEEALGELKAEATTQWEEYLNEAEIAATETDPEMSDQEREKFIDNHLLRLAGTDDEDDFVDRYVEDNSQGIEICEPVIEGEYEGVKYRITWLGGAPIIFCLQSPFFTKGKLCSPCVPGAIDLGSPDEHSDYWGYGVPPDWLDDGRGRDETSKYRRATIQQAGG